MLNGTALVPRVVLSPVRVVAIIRTPADLGDGPGAPSLALLVIVAQSIARLAYTSADDFPALRALGTSGRQLVAIARCRWSPRCCCSSSPSSSSWPTRSRPPPHRPLPGPSPPWSLRAE